MAGVVDPDDWAAKLQFYNRLERSGVINALEEENTFAEHTVGGHRRIGAVRGRGLRFDAGWFYTVDGSTRYRLVARSNERCDRANRDTCSPTDANRLACRTNPHTGSDGGCCSYAHECASSYAFSGWNRGCHSRTHECYHPNTHAQAGGERGCHSCTHGCPHPDTNGHTGWIGECRSYTNEDATPGTNAYSRRVGSPDPSGHRL